MTSMLVAVAAVARMARCDQEGGQTGRGTRNDGQMLGLGGYVDDEPGEMCATDALRSLVGMGGNLGCRSQQLLK